MMKNKGITLIALVITIIVLLILAGVAIAMLSGENGILKKAAEAKTKTEQSQKEEETTLIDMEMNTNFLTNNLKYKCRYGFITGIGLGEKANNLKTILNNEGYELNSVDNTETISNDMTLATGMAIVKDGIIVARTVIFGDITGSEGVIDIDDYTYCQQIITVDNIKTEEYQLVAADADHDGIITQKDAELIELASANTEKINQDSYAPNIKNLLSETNEKIKNKYLEIYKERIKNTTYSIEYDSSYNGNVLKGTTSETKVSEILELLKENDGNIIITDKKKVEKTADQNLEYKDRIMYKNNDGRNIFICYVL